MKVYINWKKGNLLKQKINTPEKTKRQKNQVTRLMVWENLRSTCMGLFSFVFKFPIMINISITYLSRTCSLPSLGIVCLFSSNLGQNHPEWWERPVPATTGSDVIKMYKFCMIAFWEAWFESKWQKEASLSWIFFTNFGKPCENIDNPLCQ